MLAMAGGSTDLSLAAAGGSLPASQVVCSNWKFLSAITAALPQDASALPAKLFYDIEGTKDFADEVEWRTHNFFL